MSSVEPYDSPDARRARSTNAQNAHNKQLAYSMRMVGYSYRQIGEVLNRSQGRARQLVQEAVAELPVDSIEMRRALVEDLLRTATVDIVADMKSPNPRVRDLARGRLLAYADRMIKLAGLDPASRLDVAVEDRSQAEIDLERLISEAQAKFATEEAQMKSEAEVD